MLTLARAGNILENYKTVNLANKMPPCTPEKHFNPELQDKSSDTQIGFTTPPQKAKKPNKDEPLIEKLLKSLPTVDKIFDVHRKIGEGTFSAVFLATLRNDSGEMKQFAIKHLVPTTHPKRIEVELHCLKQIGGVDNVVGLDLCLRENDNIVLITPYMRYDHFLDYAHDMQAEELALYMKNLLKAVARVHNFGIIHRDIKPNNFLYDRKNKQFLLIDFGLAQLSQAPDDNNRKRKRDNDNEGDTGCNSNVNSNNECDKNSNKNDMEPLRKRRALHMKNLYNLKDTISHLEKCAKEIPMIKIVKTPTRRSPRIQSKSPFKVPKQDVPKMRGQRKLFESNETNLENETKNTKPLETKKSLTNSSTNTTKTFEKPRHHCHCYSKPSICNICIVRKGQDAARAGTPGFRPPEVLLKHPAQTTAVDIWAVGVIMISILSKTYPFFRAPDDMTALAEMITVFGDEPIKKLAKIFGKRLICSEKKPTLNLRKICVKLRSREENPNNKLSSRCMNCSYEVHNCVCNDTPFNDLNDTFPVSCYDLLERLLDINPYTRISAEDALKHPFLNQV